VSNVKVGQFIFFRWGDANVSGEWTVDHPELASAWAMGQVTFLGKMKLYNRSVQAISIAAVGDCGAMKNLQIAIPWSWVEKDSIVILPDLLVDKIRDVVPPSL